MGQDDGPLSRLPSFFHKKNLWCNCRHDTRTPTSRQRDIAWKFVVVCVCVRVCVRVCERENSSITWHYMCERNSIEMNIFEKTSTRPFLVETGVTARSLIYMYIQGVASPLSISLCLYTSGTHYLDTAVENEKINS